MSLNTIWTFKDNKNILSRTRFDEKNVNKIEIFYHKKFGCLEVVDIQWFIDVLEGRFFEDGVFINS